MKKEFNSTEKETYISPTIKIVDIETEQNILQAGSGSAEPLDLDNEDW